MVLRRLLDGRSGATWTISHENETNGNDGVAQKTMLFCFSRFDRASYEK